MTSGDLRGLKGRLGMNVNARSSWELILTILRFRVDFGTVSRIFRVLTVGRLFPECHGVSLKLRKNDIWGFACFKRSSWNERKRVLLLGVYHDHHPLSGRFWDREPDFSGAYGWSTISGVPWGLFKIKEK